MALHGFSFKPEAHAKALLVAVNGVCAEARKKEAKLLATERDARGPAGDVSRLAVVTETAKRCHGRTQTTMDFVMGNGMRSATWQHNQGDAASATSSQPDKG